MTISGGPQGRHTTRYPTRRSPARPQKTAGSAARIVLSPDRSALAADGDDLSFVTVRIEDTDGNLVPDGDNMVHFKPGAGAVIADVDNGDPATVESFQADHRKAFHGLALVIVRPVSGHKGAITLTATADGLRKTQTVLTVR